MKERRKMKTTYQTPDGRTRLSRRHYLLLFCVVTLLLIGAAGFPLPVRAAGETSANLTVTQEIVTRMKPSDETREFYYELKATDGGPLPEGASGDTYLFDMVGTPEKIEIPISFSSAGEYSYTLRCTGADEDENNAFDSDGRIYTVKAYAEQAASGLQAWIFVHAPAEGGQSLGAKVNQEEVSLFSHERTKYPDGWEDPQIIPVEVDPPVKKQIKGTPRETDTFTFRLRALETTSGVNPMPMPEGSRNGEKIMVIHGAGEGEFGSWKYLQTGTYVYDISEIRAEDNPDYNYDKRLFTITDVVTIHEISPSLSELRVSRTIVDSNGNPVANTLITSDNGGEALGPVEFTNEYIGEDVTPTPTPTLTPTPTPGANDRKYSGRTPSDKTSAVTTGDRNRQIFWISLLLVAGLSFLLLLAAKRRRREKR